MKTIRMRLSSKEHILFVGYFIFLQKIFGAIDHRRLWQFAQILCSFDNQPNPILYCIQAKEIKQ